MGYFDTIAPPTWAADEPVMAGIIPYEAMPVTKRRISRDSVDDALLKEWYRSCGPVRVAVNTVASTVSQLKFVVEVDRGLGWERADSTPMDTLLRMFVGRRMNFEQLVFAVAVAMRTPAHGYLVLDTRQGERPAYDIVQSCNLTPLTGEHGWSQYVTSKGARPGDRGYHRVRDGFVHWFFSPDPEYPDDAWSPILAAEDAITRYKKAYRHVGRSLDSKLAMSNILWAKAVTGGSQWQQAVHEWAFNATEGDDGIEAISPLLMSTEEKPEIVETGSRVYAEQLEIAQDAMQQIARDLDFPTSWMIEGPGQAKYDNEAATWEWYLDNSVAPLAQLVAEVITDKHLRPFISATPLGQGEDPMRWRVAVDDSHLRRQSDNSAMLFDALKCGLLGEAKSAEVLGVGVTDLARRPAGVSWEEHVLITAGRNLADLNAEEAESVQAVIETVEATPIAIEADVSPARDPYALI